MKGFVPTPRETVDSMVDLLFRGRSPTAEDTLLDPGCGTGEFIDGVIRWCKRRGTKVPQITGIESDPRHLPILREKYQHHPSVWIEHADFLTDGRKEYNYVVGNPPYVPITEISESEKARYRTHYTTAYGRFDLYLLFFEEALRRLAPGGRLVFITPEKYLYVETAGPLRELLARHHVEEIRLVSEDTFGDLVTYPTITVLNHASPDRTCIVHRDHTKANVKITVGRASWLPLVYGGGREEANTTLGDLCLRVSCGIATGADAVFVRDVTDLDPDLRVFSHPTIAGRELTPEASDLDPGSIMLIPYDLDGRLLPLEDLGVLRNYLQRDDIRDRLLKRTCVRRKPWYAFHETPQLRDILQPKILCKDIADTPRFWVDRQGDIVPRHSVYYIVPKHPKMIDVIAEYLRSSAVHTWLMQNCQRASNGFIRLQSRVLQRLPVSDEVIRFMRTENLLEQTNSQTDQSELPLEIHV